MAGRPRRRARLKREARKAQRAHLNPRRVVRLDYDDPYAEGGSKKVKRRREASLYHEVGGQDPRAYEGGVDPYEADVDPDDPFAVEDLFGDEELQRRRERKERRQLKVQEKREQYATRGKVATEVREAVQEERRGQGLTSLLETGSGMTTEEIEAKIRAMVDKYLGRYIRSGDKGRAGISEKEWLAQTIRFDLDLYFEQEAAKQAAGKPHLPLTHDNVLVAAEDMVKKVRNWYRENGAPAAPWEAQPQGVEFDVASEMQREGQTEKASSLLDQIVAEYENDPNPVVRRQVGAALLSYRGYSDTDVSRQLGVAAEKAQRLIAQGRTLMGRSLSAQMSHVGLEREVASEYEAAPDTQLRDRTRSGFDPIKAMTQLMGTDTCVALRALPSKRVTSAHLLRWGQFALRGDEGKDPTIVVKEALSCEPGAVLDPLQEPRPERLFAVEAVDRIFHPQWGTHTLEIIGTYLDKSGYDESSFGLHLQTRPANYDEIVGAFRSGRDFLQEGKGGARLRAMLVDFASKVRQGAEGEFRPLDPRDVFFGWSRADFLAALKDFDRA